MSMFVFEMSRTKSINQYFWHCWHICKNYELWINIHFITSFEKFKNPESTEGSDPAIGKELRSKCIPGRQASSHQTVSPNPGDGKLYSEKNISLVWSDVFEKFKNPESIDWCALALEQGSDHWPPWGPSYGHSKEPRLVFSDFLGGLLIRSIYLGMLPTQYPH